MDAALTLFQRNSTLGRAGSEAAIGRWKSLDGDTEPTQVRDAAETGPG
jgi:hypothetical protein